MSFCCSRAQQGGRKYGTRFRLRYPPSPTPERPVPPPAAHFFGSQVAAYSWKVQEFKVEELKAPTAGTGTACHAPTRRGEYRASAGNKKGPEVVRPFEPSHFEVTLAGSEPSPLVPHHRKLMKKGAGASPLYRTDPPKNQNRVEDRCRPPREANLVSCKGREQ